MQLNIIGGVGEHGRNCFLVKDRDISFLVDCGKNADDVNDSYPHLTKQQIKTIDLVFLTHSHNDHVGALPWLYENGFKGKVIASKETIEQLPFEIREQLVLEEICPNGKGVLNDLEIVWGKSGHCVGSVWYKFTKKDKCILFSGDYIEDTQVYKCDPIRNISGEVAVIDCAYGQNSLTYQQYCDLFVDRVKEILNDDGAEVAFAAVIVPFVMLVCKLVTAVFLFATSVAIKPSAYDFALDNTLASFSLTLLHTVCSPA